MTDLKACASYCASVVRTKDILYNIFHPDGLSDPEGCESIIYVWQPSGYGFFKGSDRTPFMTVSAAVSRIPLQQLVCTSSAGELFVSGQGDQHLESVGNVRAPIRRARSINGKVHLVGMMRQVYKRVGVNKWIRLDTLAMEKTKVVVGFEAIDGFSEQDLYCAGWEGEIWHYNGKKWRQLDSPTNLILFDCCCAPDGCVYVCGQLGTILKGREDAWEVLDHGGPKVDWWNCCWFQDRLWLACDRGLYTLGTGGALERVDFGEDEPGTFRHLSTADGVLLSTGPKDSMLFDGNAWTRID